MLIDEDIHRGEKEGVTDSVEQLYEHNRRGLGPERINGKTRGVAENADHHSGSPAKPLEGSAQD